MLGEVQFSLGLALRIQYPFLGDSQSFLFYFQINIKCDGILAKCRAAGKGEHRAALKQNKTVEIWDVFPQPAPGLPGSHPYV